MYIDYNPFIDYFGTMMIAFIEPTSAIISNKFDNDKKSV